MAARIDKKPLTLADLAPLPKASADCARFTKQIDQSKNRYRVIAMPLPEKALIAALRRAARAGKGAVVTGIGDDCAVLKPPSGHEILVTTDFTLEGVHFRREWHPPEVVGRRCLTRGLSDIAAMGGQPLAVFLSLALARHASAKMG